jgi:hypothetical protein
VFALAFFIQLFLPSSAAAQDNCVSAGSGDWSTAANWTSCDSSFPENGDNVRVQIGDQITVDGDYRVNDLTIEMGVNTSITSITLNNASLDIDGDLTVGESVSGSNDSEGFTQFNLENSGSGGEALLAGDFSVLNNASLITSDAEATGTVVLDGSSQTLNLNGAVQRLESADGVTVKLDSDISVKDLVADGTPTAPSGLTVADGDGMGSYILTITGSNSSFAGELQIDSGVEVAINANVTTQGRVDVNGGDLSVGDGNELTINNENFVTQVEGILTLGTGSVLDVDGNLKNEASGDLTISNAQLEIEGDFQQANTADNSFQTASSTTIFDGIGSSTLSGTFNQQNSFSKFEIADKRTVNPEGFTSGSKLNIDGEFIVRDETTNGGTFGSGPGEDAEVIYRGSKFQVQDNNTGPSDTGPGRFFAAKISFNNSGSSLSDPVVAEGEVFSKLLVTGETTVSVKKELTVNDLLEVGPDRISLDGGKIIANDDVKIDGGFLPTGNKVRFTGRTNSGSGPSYDPGEETCTSTSNDGVDVAGVETSDGDCEQDIFGSGSLNFGPVEVDGENTRVVLSQGSNAPTTPTISNLTIDTGTDDTNVQFVLDQTNLDITGNINNDGSLFSPGSEIVTLRSDSRQEIESAQTIDFGVLAVDNGSAEGVILNGASVRASRELRVLDGKINVGAGDILRVGGRTLLSSGNGETSIEQSGDGKVILESSGTNQAYIEYTDSEGNGTLDGIVTGDITFERRMIGGQNWYFLASPVSSGGTPENDTFDGYLQTSDQTSGITDLLTKGLPGSDKPSFNEASVRLYDEQESGAADFTDPGWKPIDCSGFRGCSSNGLNDPLKDGRGYAVYVWGTPQDDGFPKTIDTKLEMSQSPSFEFSTSDGSPSDGPGIDATPQSDGNIDEDDGWNLLGNPYFATIDFCSASGLTRGSDLSPTVYVWDPLNANDGTSASGYASFNCDTELGGGDPDPSDPVEDPPDPPPGGQTLTEGYIAPHQSFFVKANETGSAGDLTLRIDDITQVQTNSTGAFLKNETEKPPGVQLRLSSNGMAYVTSVGFVENRSKGLDHSDGFYNGGPDEQSGLSFYSVLRDGTGIVTNAMPRSLSDETTIPLRVDACNYGDAIDGPATISWPILRNLPVDWGVVLVDTKNDERVDMRSNSEYTFTLEGQCPSSGTQAKSGSSSLARLPSPDGVKHETSKNGGPDTRFQLRIVPNATIPVEFSSFTGSVADNAAKLEWTTATEQNNAGFQVQRKVDGSFQNIDGAFVEGAGTSEEPQSYSYRVEDLDAGQHTFRLKQVDVDGGSSFSKETTVKVGLDSQYELKAYPNPISEQATIKFAVKESQDVTLELYNTLGQRVQVLHQGSVPSSQTRTVSLQASDLSSGLYIVRMRGESFSTTKSVTVVR